jgi:hypothetical protein
MDCDITTLSLRQSAEEKKANLAPTLTGGVGSSFNEPPVSFEISFRPESLIFVSFVQAAAPAYGRVLNTLVFFQLFSTLAMKRLIGYGNRECGTAIVVLC